MVLLFFILLLKRLYMRPIPTAVMSPGHPNGHGGQMPGIPGAVHLHEAHHGNSCPTWVPDINQSQMDTGPPPFESVVGLSKGEFKSDNLSCDTSHLDMECPPPSYEEYLGVVNKAYTAKEDMAPEKS
ncbi:unnamed protein product [Allacma fusca]|uniref:Uncharacterized protein n=1 Tax=Allacma fusca TaxID=39272 RepID=A0A8J2KD67_9HEXA|nr:unnamed protein product [Allacma fusca]